MRHKDRSRGLPQGREPCAEKNVALCRSSACLSFRFGIWLPDVTSERPTWAQGKGRALPLEPIVPLAKSRFDQALSPRVTVETS